MSWFGRGIASRTVLAFLSRASMTVRSFSSAPALGIANNGMAFLPWAGFHQPAFMYHCVFSLRNGNSAAAHFGVRDEYLASGFISNIV